MTHSPRGGAPASSLWRRRAAACALLVALVLGAPAFAAGASGVVNLNTASAVELELLPGIGEKRAGDIVALRKELGRFERVEDLLEVKGIGEKALAKMRPYLVLQGKTTLAEN